MRLGIRQIRGPGSVSRYLILSKMLIRHLVHKTFGPCQKGFDIRSYLVPSKMSTEMETVDPHPKVLDIWSCPKPFGMEKICSWTFWIGPAFKDLLAWT